MTVESPFDKARPKLVVRTHNGEVAQPFTTEDELWRHVRMLVLYVPVDSEWWVEP